MDEELYQLLSEGKKRGYDDAKLKELIVWYNQKKPPASFEQPKPSSNYLNYVKEEETPETYTPLTNLAVKAYNVVANQSPENLANRKVSIVSNSDFDKELVNEFNINHPYKDVINDPSLPEAKKKLMDFVGGEEIYNQRKELFEKNKQFQTRRFNREVATQAQEGQDHSGQYQ